MSIHRLVVSSRIDSDIERGSGEGRERCSAQTRYVKLGGLTVKLNEPKSSWFTIRSKFDAELSVHCQMLVHDVNLCRRGSHNSLYTLDWTCFCEHASELFFRCITE